MNEQVRGKLLAWRPPVLNDRGKEGCTLPQRRKFAGLKIPYYIRRVISDDATTTTYHLYLSHDSLLYHPLLYALRYTNFYSLQVIPARLLTHLFQKKIKIKNHEQQTSLRNPAVTCRTTN